MIVEICGGKTKCQGCGKNMRKGDIRGKYGTGWYNDPYRYYCEECFKKKEINIIELKKIYKKKMNEFKKKIKFLEKMEKEI